MMQSNAATADDIVRECWCEALDVREVSPHDDFFQLGGNSLLAVTLLERIEQRLGLELPFEALFVEGTYGALRDSVRGATGGVRRDGAAGHA
jgi:acyl carrier protein